MDRVLVSRQPIYRADMREFGYDLLFRGRFRSAGWPAMRLMVKLNSAEVDVDELQKVISADVTLSYKLLRYINSALYSLARNVTSIRHAIMLVG
jgi:c-di-GMP-related signal transduction protein